MMKRLLFKIANTRLGFFLNHVIAMAELSVMRLYRDPETIRLLSEIINESGPILVRTSELFLLHSFAKHQTSIPGDYAEVGVFQGSTAKAICAAKGDKELFLFDTFQGLPQVGASDGRFKTGLFKASKTCVEERLRPYPGVHVCEGLFPESAASVSDRKFAFVHLDVDLYESTFNSLEFFYGRMSVGGMIISHDYQTAGVRRAFDEFFKDLPEQVIELHLSQCLVIKC